jgi:hypothetical protein
MHAVEKLFSYIALLIAAYGAILSTYSAFMGRRRLEVKYGQGILALEDKSLTSFSSIEVTNRSNIPIYIRKYGFEMDNQDLHVRKLDEKMFDDAQEMSLNESAGELIPINSINDERIADGGEIQPGKKVVSMFYTRDLYRGDPGRCLVARLTTSLMWMQNVAANINV